MDRVKLLEAEMEVLRNENECMRQELEAIRAQLLPHFMFPPEWGLPRREKQMLAILATAKSWMVKERLCVLSGMSIVTTENIVESHVSKLKAKIRSLGLPITIQGKRFDGYFMHADGKEYLAQFIEEHR